MQGGKHTVLVCAAHPDDEVLGCGGVMARHADNGDTVHVLLVADGVGSRGKDERSAVAEIEERRSAAVRAAVVLGASPPRFLDFPDQRLDTVPLLEITQAIEAVTREITPEIVYTHHAGDLNADHRMVALATLTACRPLPGSCVRAIYGCETQSSTGWAAGAAGPEFLPVRFVAIAGTLARKLDALHAYEYEMCAFPHARSYAAIEALARFRGVSVGVEAAEAFTVLREIKV